MGNNTITIKQNNWYGELLLVLDGISIVHNGTVRNLTDIVGIRCHICKLAEKNWQGWYIRFRFANQDIIELYLNKANEYSNVMKYVIETIGEDLYRNYYMSMYEGLDNDYTHDILRNFVTYSNCVMNPFNEWGYRSDVIPLTIVPDGFKRVDNGEYFQYFTELRTREGNKFWSFDTRSDIDNNQYLQMIKYDSYNMDSSTRFLLEAPYDTDNLILFYANPLISRRDKIEDNLYDGHYLYEEVKQFVRPGFAGSVKGFGAFGVFVILFMTMGYGLFFLINLTRFVNVFHYLPLGYSSLIILFLLGAAVLIYRSISKIGSDEPKSMTTNYNLIFSMLSCLSLLSFAMVWTWNSSSAREYRETNLREVVPSIYVYGSDRVDLKENLKVNFPNSEIAEIKNSFKTHGSEKEIVEYYEKELTKNGWSKFDVVTYSKHKCFVSRKGDKKLTIVFPVEKEKEQEKTYEIYVR